jgi:WD40 repeat protein
VVGIQVWDLADGGERPGFTTEEEIVGNCMLAMSSDYATLVSGHQDGIIVWDVASRQPRRIIRGIDDRFGGRTHGLAISPDGRFIASKAGDRGTNKVYLWDATTGEPLLLQDETHGQSVLGVAYSPDEKVIATGSADNSVRLWNAATGEHIRTIDQGAGWVRYVEFFPDGERIALGRETQPGFVGEVKICRVADGHVLHKLSMPDRVMCGALSADGKQLAVGIGLNDLLGLGARGRNPNGEAPIGPQIVIWDTDGGQKIAESRALTGQLLQLVFSPRGDELWSTSDDGRVRKWNPSTGEELPIPNASEPAEGRQAFRQAVFVPSSSRMVFADSQYIRGEGSRSNITLRPLNSEQPLWQKDLGSSRATLVAASPNGELLVTQLRASDGAAVDDRIVLWSLPDGRELLSLPTEDNYARTFAFSRDGRLLISGMELGDTLVWDISGAQSVGAR